MNEISEVGYVTIWCAELTGTREFFKEVVGLPIAFENSDVVVFGIQGTQLVLHRAYGENEFRAGTVQIGFYVDKLDPLLRKLRQSSTHLSIERMVIEAEQPLASVRMPGGQYAEFVQRVDKPDSSE
jgi:extradiol dioxygenase family protein